MVTGGQAMTRSLIYAATAVSILTPAGLAEAASRRPAAAAVVATPAPVPTADCSAFYDDYALRGYGWGSSPGSSVGFGLFEGALPRYPDNSFPNWYGACVEWGHYSASGSARR
jgi:hypothetical protein